MIIQANIESFNFLKPLKLKEKETKIIIQTRLETKCFFGMEVCFLTLLVFYLLGLECLNGKVSLELESILLIKAESPVDTLIHMHQEELVFSWSAKWHLETNNALQTSTEMQINFQQEFTAHLVKEESNLIQRII